MMSYSSSIGEISCDLAVQGNTWSMLGYNCDTRGNVIVKEKEHYRASGSELFLKQSIRYSSIWTPIKAIISAANALRLFPDIRRLWWSFLSVGIHA
ncbi:hypothetical protein TNCV_2488561 [Trichonephila clavipes]|nr:hypothetical protein TNCV_2488561 [Trichonephila clavipes]